MSRGQLMTAANLCRVAVQLLSEIHFIFYLYYRPFYRKPETPVNAHFVNIQKHLSLTSNKEIEGGRSLAECHYIERLLYICYSQSVKPVITRND